MLLCRGVGKFAWVETDINIRAVFFTAKQKLQVFFGVDARIFKTFVVIHAAVRLSYWIAPHLMSNVDYGWRITPWNGGSRFTKAESSLFVRSLLFGRDNLGTWLECLKFFEILLLLTMSSFGSFVSRGTQISCFEFADLGSLLHLFSHGAGFAFFSFVGVR